MRFVFRTDASLKIGTGHVMRCLTLADALRQEGAECQFVCREHEGHLVKHIESRGYRVHALPKPSANISFDPHIAHASWLGVDWSTDAQQTQQSLSGTKYDWLIVDHYALDHRWESAMRTVCKRLMVIDDLADRRRDCDLLLNQNYGSSAQHYVGLALVKSTQLHGPEFALLKPVYSQRRLKQSPRSGKIEQVLIYFGGGTDPFNLTRMTLCAFQAQELTNIELNIVIGSSYAHKEKLEAAAAARGRTRIYEKLPDLSALISSADLAVGAGGATTWERCCLGLPSLVSSIADNQRSACQALSADQLIIYLGNPNQVSCAQIRTRILTHLKNPDFLHVVSQKCMRLVDGNGTMKVVQRLANIA